MLDPSDSQCLLILVIGLAVIVSIVGVVWLLLHYGQGTILRDLIIALTSFVAGISIGAIRRR
jgi:uncharacterized membrane protein